MTTKATHGRSKKVLWSAAAIGAAASVAGLGTYATFTDTTSASQSISSGTVDINLGTPGVDNRLTVDASGIVPGDTMQRRVKLSNDGSEDLASITLTTSATTSSLLDSDATNGLQFKIETCDGGVGWTETGSTPGFRYTCDDLVPGDGLGTRTTVLARRAIVGSTLSLSNLTATTAGNTDDTVVTIDLPTTADNTFQGLSSTIDYTFTATQRAATDK